MYLPFEFKIEQLICVQQERPLFKPLNFILKNQQILLLHGPNGVGKTTCLRTLAGLLPAARGAIYWQNQTITHNENYLQHMAYLGHLSGLKLALTPTENLQTYLTLICREQQIKRIPVVLAELNLCAEADTLCGHLSAGQQRRVALARLFLAEIPLWILDEPQTALDKQGMNLLHELLTKHVQQGGAAVLTSHTDFTDATQTIAVEPWIV